jgi:uncharacterized membrane protein YjjP (DUF1212 family)
MTESLRPSAFGRDPSLSPDELADYLAEIGGMLVAYGCPAYRLEDVIRMVGLVEGFEAQAFAFPTGLFVSIVAKGMERPVLRMMRVKEWGVALDRLADIDEIFNEVAQDRLTIRAAIDRLRALKQEEPLYPRALQFMATALVSAAAAVFFRGGTKEIAVASAIGACVGVMSWALSKTPSSRSLVELGGSFLAALAAWTITRARPDISREVLVLSGVITLVPGMTLTTGLAELARKNLVTGSARLMEAFAGFLLIIFGIALALGIEKLLGDRVPFGDVPRHGLGALGQISAVLAASVALAVLFSVPRRYWWSSVLSAGIGWVTTGLGTRYLPGQLAAFGAALAISLYANLAARITQRPAQLFQLPGMTLLVPGSFGFLSLEAFLRGELAGGAAKGFEMLLIAGGIVAGVLMANVLLPAKKLL